MNIRGLVVVSMIVGPILPACQTPSRVAPAALAPDFEISANERERAVALARGSSDFRTLAAGQPVYLVGVDVLRDKQAEIENRDTARELLVTHYAARTDTAILTRVNLDTDQVAAVEAVPHLPVRLSREEFEMARRMALEDPRVQAALGGRDVEVEAQLSRTSDAKDPQYRHRVLHLLFKTPEGYLDAPIVIVDLTAGKVIVE